MKRLLLLLAGIAMSFMTFAQSMDTYAEAQQDKLRPYIGPGIGLSGGLATRSMEVGVWNDKVWYAIVYENTPNVKFDSTMSGYYDTAKHNTIYIGPKFYRKVKTYNKVDMFIYAATKIGINENGKLPLQFEPGACLVWNVTSHIGLQWSFSSPMYENVFLLNKPSLSTSFAANWFF